MIYQQANPPVALAPWIKSFWLVDGGNSTTITEEKIVPDGYPEMIFHYGDPYQINITGKWETQSKLLLAGQLSKYIRLRNTGKARMFAIKFQPWTPNALFKVPLAPLTDKVVPIASTLKEKLAPIYSLAISNLTFEEKVSSISEIFLQWETANLWPKETLGQLAAQEIIAKKGNVSVQELISTLAVKERTLQRHFKEEIGTTPKFYSRIIRLASIFQLIQEGKENWAQITYIKGFYDQSHFIKDFITFTGDKPSQYGFDEKNMANLFLKG